MVVQSFIITLFLGIAIVYLIFRRLHDLFHGHVEGAPETKGLTIRWAKLYDPVKTMMLWILGGNGSLEKASLEHAGINKGEQILDVGCGTGTLAIEAKKQVGDGKVYGIDASPEMIIQAEKKLEKLGLDIEFKIGLIESIPHQDNEFDLVLSSLMMHHLPSEELKLKGLEEIHRVLKPGGRLLIIDLEPPEKGIVKHFMNHLFGHHVMENDIRKLRPLVEKVGFKDIEIGRTSHKVLSYVKAVK